MAKQYDLKRSGKQIHQLRIKNGYTQEKLAKELNIDRSLISYIETGKRGCTVDMLVQLSSLFGVSLDFLILGKEADTSSDDVDRAQLKTDIGELINSLESLRKKL